ncbi:MAG TPA: hypothetical protein VGO64_03910 [Candidatus Limnocylindrales bacterium]|jgi:hypothetical protein|nr:hypothetical protein [Candidatus Limnocylindrales bacterium]
MAVDLRAPDHVRFRIAGVRRRRDDLPGWLGVTVRGLLTGFGTALVLVGGSHAVESVAAVGILALGAALVSWDR